MHIARIINEISKKPCTKHCKIMESDIKPMQIATNVDSFSKKTCETQGSIPRAREARKLWSRMPSDRMNTPLTQTRSFASPARTHERNETNTISRLGDVKRKTHKPQSYDTPTHTRTRANTRTHTHTHTHARTRIHTHTQTHTDTHARTYARTHAHTQNTHTTQTHTHTHTHKHT